MWQHCEKHNENYLHFCTQCGAADSEALAEQVVETSVAASPSRAYSPSMIAMAKKILGLA